MSSKASRMAKKIVGPDNTFLRFPEEMYSNIYGSVVLCAYMFSKEDERPSIGFISETWDDMLANPDSVSWTLEHDSDGNYDLKGFVENTLSHFNMSIPALFPVVFVQGKTNALFAPYVDGHVLPLREDGFMGRTLRFGEVIPLNF